MSQLYAQPYNITAQGFYFSSPEEFTEQYKKRLPVEEYEIQFIDGGKGDAELFKAAGIGQMRLSQWFEEVAPLEPREKAALFYLLDTIALELPDALAQIDDVCLSECRLLEAATELFDDCYAHDIPENLRGYIDYEAFARDCDICGDMDEFSFAGRTWTCTNAATI